MTPTDTGKNIPKIAKSVLVSVLSMFIGVTLIFSQEMQFQRISGAPESFEAHFDVVRRGIRRDAVRLIAPVAVRAPVEKGLDGMSLEFFAAPVFNVGDGMKLEIFMASDQGEELLYSRYFDAGRKAGDRDWAHIEIPLPARPAARWLLLRVSGGPQGDLDADWLAVSSLTLLRKAP
jgi:hypothetical protein